MHRVRIAGSALAFALAAGATFGAPALVAHAASFTSTVTSGRLNQGTLPGGSIGLPGGQSGTTQPTGQGGGTPSGGSQGTTGGVQGSTGSGQGTTGGGQGTVSPVPGSVTSSGGVTSGRFSTTTGAPSSVLFPQAGSSGSSTLLPQPQQGGSTPSQPGGTSTTPSQPGGTSTTPGSGSPQNELQYVLGLVNGQRQQVDAQPLVLDPALTTLAQERAQAMAANNVISHDVPGYGYANVMETAAGITGTLIGGEDIATGLTVDEAFWNLVTSPWHDANMLFASYNTVGIGVATMPNGTYVLDLLFIER